MITEVETLQGDQLIRKTWNSLRANVEMQKAKKQAISHRNSTLVVNMFDNWVQWVQYGGKRG